MNIFLQYTKPYLCKLLFRFRFAAAVYAWLILSAVVFEVSVASAAETLTLSVARTPLSLPIYVAQSEGYFAAEGLQLKLNDVIGGVRALQQVLSGEADFATTSDAAVMFNSFKRNDFAIVTTFVTSNDDVKVITRKGAGIVRADQLVGKRVGTIPGSASHYYLDNFLISHGVDPKKIKLVGLQPEAMAAALNKGEVDAIVAWEPYAFEALHSVEGSKILPNVGGYVLSFNLITHAKHKHVRDNDLVKMLRALDRAQYFIKTEPIKAQAILRDRLQLDQAFIDWIWTRNNYRLSLDQSLLATMEGEARWARQEGHVKAYRSPNFLEFIYSGPLRRVAPDSVGIVE